MSPVFKLWELIVITLDDVLIPVELNPIGFIKIFPVVKFLLTYTDVEVPIPTERFGFTFKTIASLFDNWCEVETETVDITLSTWPVIWE